MLCLLHTPAWHSQGEPPAELPLVVPAALLVVLATTGGWLTRESLALIFWPEAARSDALHHVRINLHRAKTLLARWGVEAALETERARVRLSLPTDLPPLNGGNAPAGAGPSPAAWLQGWRLSGYEGFGQWCDDTSQQLHSQWLVRSRLALPAQSPASPVASQPTAASGQPSAGPPGREAEFRRLLDSGSAAVLLLGEPGAGKTTLLTAAYPDALCLHGLDGLHAMPYRPLLDVLRAQAAALERMLRLYEHPLRPYRLDLARVLPELAPDDPLPPLDAITAKTRLVEALTRAFEALTPVLLIDDLQWCDGSTLEWLLMLAHSGRLKWRAAARRQALSVPQAQALQTLSSFHKLEELDVSPLTREALARACRARWPQQGFSDARLDWLHSISGGNPFMLGELVAAGLDSREEATPASVRTRVFGLVLARLRGLPAAAQQAVEAAAVFVQPVPARALGGASGSPGPADEQWPQVCARAVDASLLQPMGAGLSCRHDLIRQAIVDSLSSDRKAALHRQAALWLGLDLDNDSLTIAEHWLAAGEPQTALAWRHRGAEQLKNRGRFDEARALWREVADDSLDATQSLRARLELAACDLFQDLDRGEQALSAVCVQLHAVADTVQHRQLESRALAALVDNRVFAGDIARARGHAARLRVLLPDLSSQERVHVLEVLIELAMREPDIAAAWAMLAELREAGPGRPTLLSFEGQIHWFGGQVQAAHDALARLLKRCPEYCSGITVENDLAVMLQALGRIDEAEAMARRSLHSWAGVPHTETLSLLVLGLVLTSAGRHAEADLVLLRAQALAREQGSPGFEAESLVRRARLLLQCGRLDQAREALDRAAPLLAASPEPLRVSQLVLAQVQLACGSGQTVPPEVLARLQAASQRTAHPLVQVRAARVANELAAAADDWAAAAAAADLVVDLAQRAGLQEPLAEGLLLQARAASDEAMAIGRVTRALELARRHGFADVRWRAASWLTVRLQDPDTSNEALIALQQLRGSGPEPLFDAEAAARREPVWR